MCGASMPEAILEVRDLVKYFPVRVGVLFKRTIGQVKAVDGVSFELNKGETLGVVGESGCGKSTLAQVLMRLEPPTSGTALFQGRDIFAMRGAAAGRDHLRRAGVRAGRLDPGAGDEPVGRAAVRVRTVLCVHRARPVRGA